MDVTSVVQELRALNGPVPVFNPARDPEQQSTAWIMWSAGQTLIDKWEEQCNKRTAGAENKAKSAASTSMTPIRSMDYIRRP